MPDVSVPQVSPPSLWRSDVKPWWAPDAQGFTIASVIIIVAIALFYRMTHPSDVNDKMLETMLTILFGTAFVAIVNYLFGSSRGSSAKDDTISRISSPTPPPAPAPGTVTTVATPPSTTVTTAPAAPQT